MVERVRVHVTGIVQGVGFRPHVHKLAVKLGLAGFILNTSRGVTIEVEGPQAKAFTDILIKNHPPLADIKTIESEYLPPAGYNAFEIRLSEETRGEFSLVSPDIAACPDCLKEMYDIDDRRYLYPFINCTNCGPRYSIIQGVPYDRPLTTMRRFTMCKACEAEYDDPDNRRFHAQPTACPACGPQVTFSFFPPPLCGGGAGVGEAPVTGFDALKAATVALIEGKVLALKGLGGYQLVCDAANDAAVKRLRARKRKSRKPFALMARDIGVVRKSCELSAVEEGLLTSRTAPIVLLRKTGGSAALSPDVAPGNNYIGFMLPCAPLHHLLFHNPMFKEVKPPALVMTSGNLSEEPIVIDNGEAEKKLPGLADCFLMHDRDIYMRVDDSVTRVVSGVPRLIRRARGYVPEPIDLGRDVPEILACGGELKNTLCITKGSYAIMSQHIGDLTNFEAMSFFEETLFNLKRTFRAAPTIIAHDMHPDYMSTRFAQGYMAGDDSVTRVPAQHHHAHVAACMAENGESGKVIGIAFDGTGYGLDGHSWGSEFLISDLSGFERFAHIGYIPLPGGDKAVQEPWRIALSLLVLAYGNEAQAIFDSIKPGAVPEKDVSLVLRMMEKGINCPLSSGMGRLFDGVSSLIGLMDAITFEGEAAIALEMAATGTKDAYPFKLIGDSPMVIDTRPLVRAVVDDLQGGTSRGEIAGRFHNTVADMALTVCGIMRENTGLGTIALSGGVFQNSFLFGLVERGLVSKGFRVLTHSKVPTNDACISLGQAAIAAATVG